MLSALTFVAAASASAAIAIAPQYDSTHVYVAAPDFDRFVSAFTATFGGKTSAKGSATVTPTPSKTFSQLIITPAGTVSVFGYQTPIPYPFGLERTGYLVRDMDAAVTAARGDGAAVVVAPFDDPIGRDAIVEWPGGVDMQLYWHTVPPRYDPLETIPENRVYVSPDAADTFIHDFSEFSKGTVTEDDASANGSEIGRPGYTYRRVKFQSVFGKMTVFVTDGHLPYPYGRETTGYEVQDLAATLKKATDAGATVLIAPLKSTDRTSAMIQFPGGYIAEVHQPLT